MVRALSACLLALGLATASAQPAPQPAPMPAPWPLPEGVKLTAWTPKGLVKFTTDEQQKVATVWDSLGDPKEYAVAVWVQKDVGGVWVDVPGEANVQRIANGSILVNAPNSIGSYGPGLYCVCSGAADVSTGAVIATTWKYFAVFPAE